MKLTIKNYDKVLGWWWFDDNLNQEFRWMIDKVYQNSDDYTFHISLEDSDGNIKKSVQIILSRNGVMDGGRYVYTFLPHKHHQVSADWIEDLANVQKAFESEMRRFGHYVTK